MALGRYLLWMGMASLVACGSGNNGADADDSPCVGSINKTWPDKSDPTFCTLPWETTSPALTLTECGDVGENCSEDGPTPDFSCLTNPVDPPAGPAMVELTGFVDVFSSGPSADKARIEVYLEEQLAQGADFDAVTPIAQTDVNITAQTAPTARACPAETSVNRGECIVPTNDCVGCDTIINGELNDTEFCLNGTCREVQRWEIRYTLSNIPTNKFLIIRTVGLDENNAPQVLGNVWAQLIQTNVYLSTADPACTGLEDADCLETGSDLYRKNVNVLSAQDYKTIPTSAGLSAGISSGNGAIAGEVHDCQRRRVQHAQIGFGAGRTPRVLVYFNGNPVKTLPSLSRSGEGTNSLALYSGLDIKPGPIDLVGIGVASSALRETGRFTTRVWADSVTLVTIGGGRPQR